MKIKKLQLFGILIAVVLVLGFVVILKFSPESKNPEKICPECTRLTAGVTGASMFPLLSDGDIVTYYTGYYQKNLPKNGDIVIYDFGGSSLPVIKQVRVTDKDTVSIDSTRKTLLINGETMKNSQMHEYIFSSPELQMLGLYISNGKIPSESYFIFGDNVSQSNDSRKFGAISRRDLLGRAFIQK